MTKHSFACVEGHTEGIPGRMMIDGAPSLHGSTMNDRGHDFVERYDWIRRALMLEPRGHAHMSGTILYPPLTSDADFSLLSIETSGCLPMCGHATIGSISFALEARLVVPKSTATVTVDVLAGRITARDERDRDRITSVRFTNVHSFLLHRDIKIDFAPLGELLVDIAYGGNFYPILEVQTNYPGCEQFAPELLLEWDRDMERLVNEVVDVVHPENRAIRNVKHCMWTGRPVSGDADARAVMVAGNSRIDRSPCGSGSSARVAQRFARGWLKEGEAFRHESLIGSRFIGRVESQSQLRDGTDAVFPSIEGRAWITGRAQHFVEDGQPYAHSFSQREFSN